MNKMPITMLNGFGCPDCNGTCGDMMLSRPLYGLGATNVDVSTLINGKLRSLSHNVNTYTSSTGTRIRTVPAGQVIGTIYSWVKDAYGNVWYMLDVNGKYEYVKHLPGVFDFQYILDTVREYEIAQQKEIDARVEARKEENTSFWYNGQGFKDFANEVKDFAGKYAGKAVLIIGTLYIVNTVVKESIRKRAV